MSASKNIMAGISPGFTVEVSYDDGPSGPRRADAVGSQAIVMAAAASDFSKIAKQFIGRLVVYVLCGQGNTYIGRGQGESRLPSQLNAKAFTEKVFVLFARDIRLDDDAVKFLEAKLIGFGLANGVPLANKVVARGPKIRKFGHLDYDRMFTESLLFLAAAGCAIFSPPGQAPYVGMTPKTSWSEGYRIVPAADYKPPNDAVKLELVHGRLSGQAYDVDSKWIVAPGTEFSITGKGDLRGSDVRRRETLLQRDDLFVTVADHNDRKRLTEHYIEFDLKGTATRVITGAHSPCANWVPVETDKDPTAADGGSDGL